jgi:hypothetical protein
MVLTKGKSSKSVNIFKDFDKSCSTDFGHCSSMSLLFRIYNNALMQILSENYE